ncbi:MAG: metallophosphoesterase, partial [Stellaceae bacterium]
SELPRAFEGYRILHLSDTHLDCLPNLATVARAMLKSVEVDLVVLTGDIHGRHRAPLQDSVGPLAAMLEGLEPRDGRIAVLGNHDPAAMAEALEDLGFAVLINRSTTLERGAERLVLTGHDDVHRFFTPAARTALGAAPPGFRIALVHSAEMADHAEAEGYSLYLCGHTHGGQLCLPGGRPVLTHLRRCRFGARGAWRCGRMVGYTSNGLGVSGAPLRYNCPGEMAVITLHRERAKG